MPRQVYPNVPEDEVDDFVEASGGVQIRRTEQEEKDALGRRLFTVELEFSE